MRTTIEITEDQRAELLKLAAQRGLKGFSQVVQEALDDYIAKQSQRQAFAKAALKLEGTLSEKDADEMETTRASLRGSWR